MNALPRAFVERMIALLGAEAQSFLAAYEQPPRSALRVNTLKLSVEEFSALGPFPLSPIPWCSSGSLLPAEHAAGKHPFHVAGLYYLQEPSAMAVGEILNAQPGERVLDLCAAPGGKSTHLAAQLQGSGVLVANEIIPSRARILAENLERWGAQNTLITVESPERLAAKWPEFFDRVLVDAPCSGEGMFRKSATAIQEWSPEHIRGCALRQGRILDQAALLLRPGGALIYSTCTFAPEENEGTIADFLKRHADFEITAIAPRPGFSLGRPEWVNAPEALRQTVRIWPHLAPGEGHFIARLRRREGDSRTRAPRPRRRRDKQASAAIRAYQAFCADNLRSAPIDEPTLSGDRLYQTPEDAPDTDGLRVLWPGWELGNLQKGRFEPSHALALGLARQDAQRTLDLSPDEGAAQRYLYGESLKSPGEDGWVLITIAGYPLGWGKRVGGIVKNHYPRALRWPRRLQE
jgi:NOL1/NOP2/sun family putative RNA methylase